MDFVSIYDVQQPTFVNLLRSTVTRVSVAGTRHRPTDVPSTSSLSAANRATSLDPPFPSNFRVSTSFLDSYLTPCLYHYCQAVDSAQQRSALFSPGGIIRDAERTARQEPLGYPLQGEQGLFAYIKSGYVDPINNLLRDPNLTANTALDGGLRRLVVEGCGRTLKTDFFLMVGQRRRAVIDVKSPNVAPGTVFGAIVEAGLNRQLAIDTDSGLVARIPLTGPDEHIPETGETMSEAARRIVKQIWAQMVYHECRIGVVTTFNHTLVFVAERDAQGQSWISASPILAGMFASEQHPYHKMLALLLGLSVLPDSAYDIPSEGSHQAPALTDEHQLEEMPPTEGEPGPSNGAVPGVTSVSTASSTGAAYGSHQHQRTPQAHSGAGGNSPDRLDAAARTIDSERLVRTQVPTPESSPESKKPKSQPPNAPAYKSGHELESHDDRKDTILCQPSAALRTPPSSPLGDRIPLHLVGEPSCLLVMSEDVSVRRSAGQLHLPPSSTLRLYGPLDPTRLTRPTVPELSAPASERTVMGEAALTIQVAGFIGGGAIWNAYRCVGSAGSDSFIMKITSPTVYLLEDARSLPELIIDNASGHAASAVRAAIRNDICILHYLCVSRFPWGPVLHGAWAGVQSNKEVWAVLMEDCGQAVKPDQLSPREKMQLVGAYRALHAIGVLHRDIEARHWRQKTPGGTIKLIDFDHASFDPDGRLHTAAQYEAELRQVKRELRISM